MFPVPTILLENVKYKNIDKYRTFKDFNERSRYIALLKDELAIINTLNIEAKAINIYNLKINKPNDTISKRCLDFKMLEKIALSIK